MEVKDVIEVVEDGVVAYHMDNISEFDVINTREYIEEEKLEALIEFNIYEGIIHQQIVQNVQWYLDTEMVAYLDSARELLFSLIEQYIEEGVL